MRVLCSLAFCSILMMQGCGGGGGGSDACSSLNARIFGGETCSQTSRTPVVQFAVQFADGLATKCTGTLITLDDILTSAHCFYNNGIPVVEALAKVGGNNGEFIEIVNFSIHPFYTGAAGDLFDIAMATIKYVPTPAIGPMPLLYSEFTGPGSRITAYGYGTNDNGVENILKAAEFTVDTIENGNLVVYGDGDSSVCPGDSGGPAVYVTSNGIATLAGINSYIVRSGGACVNTASEQFGFVDVQYDVIFEFIGSYAPDFSVG